MKKSGIPFERVEFLKADMVPKVSESSFSSHSPHPVTVPIIWPHEKSGIPVKRVEKRVEERVEKDRNSTKKEWNKSVEWGRQKKSGRVMVSMILECTHKT